MKQLSLKLILGRVRAFGVVTSCILLVASLTTGCKPKSATPSGDNAAGAGGYFQTPFQSECEFVVYAIATDLAEQMYYAANHRLPDKKSFAVRVVERKGTASNRPVYAITISLEPKLPAIGCEVSINETIWSPKVYQGMATQMARVLGLKEESASHEADTAMLVKLKDAKAETIERENQRLSAALEEDFSDPELHEQAAALLGAFMIREHSGKFFEIRSPLARLTTHLTMARFLRGSQPAGINGQLAEAMMLTLVENQARALEILKGVGTNNATALPMARALQVRNTGDYRLLDKIDGLSRVEVAAWFSAWADYVSPIVAWPKLSEGQKQTVDFTRVANELNYPVEVGHQLLQLSIPLEIEEAQNVYELSQKKKLPQKKLVEALNEIPDGCFTRTDSKPILHVIGWGQWAGFLQRHLCHAIQQNHYFMSAKWGVPDEAKDFAAKCEESFSQLRLYPFVRRFICSEVNDYHKAVDDGFKVTVATPQLVSGECWNYLCYKVNFAPLYNPNPNPHINEWHSHNPPPGTVYDLNPRLNHPSFTGQPDIVARLEQLHEIAPNDCRIIENLLKRKYGDKPTYEQAAELFGPLLNYSVTAMRTVARIVYAQPEQYRKLMLRVAAVSPTGYYDLADYEADHNNPDDAAKFLEQACAADPDSVRIASRAPWRVNYFLSKGDIKKARAIADEAGDVYSARGLAAKASFFEATTNYAAAFEWYAKIEERYNNPEQLIEFCQRYKQLTGDTRFDAELKKREQSVFPRGAEKVSLAEFKAAPADGVVIKQNGKLLEEAGLQAGNVIVALNGTRVRGMAQYAYLRSLLAEPEMRLIVWQNGSYQEIKASPPNHLFGVPFADYKPK